MEGLFLETVLTDFICKIFFLTIQWTFNWISRIFHTIFT